MNDTSLPHEQPDESVSETTIAKTEWIIKSPHPRSHRSHSLHQQLEEQAALLKKQTQYFGLLQQVEAMLTGSNAGELKVVVNDMLDAMVKVLAPDVGLAMVVRNNAESVDAQVFAVANAKATGALSSTLKAKPFAYRGKLDFLDAKEIFGQQKHIYANAEVIEGFLDLFGPGEASKLNQQLALQSVAVMPLASAKEQFGLLVFGLASDPNEYNAPWSKLLSALASAVSVAFANAENNQKLREEDLNLMILQNATNQIVQGGVNFDEMSQKIVDVIYEDLGYLGAFILSNEPNGDMRLAGHSRIPIIDKIIKEFSINTTTLKGTVDDSEFSMRIIWGKETIVTDKLSDVISPSVPIMMADVMQKMVGMKSLVSMPIMAEEQVFGMLTVGLNKPREMISTSELEMMKTMTHMYAIVLRNGQYYETIEQNNKYLTQLDKAKTEFLSIASHQLRTPLTAIDGYMTLLGVGGYGEMPDQQKEVIGKTKENIRRLVTLVNDLLGLARIETGSSLKGVLAAEIDLRVIIDRVVDEVSMKAQKKNVSLEWERPAGEVKAFVDQSKMEQVFVNIIDNAVDYTKQGKVVVQLENKPQRILLKVRDTGIGIDKESLQQLFTKFHRSPNARIVRPDGTGIGLFIAKIYVEAHQGKIHVESKVGKGTTFTVELPKKEKEEGTVEEKAGK